MQGAADRAVREGGLFVGGELFSVVLVLAIVAMPAILVWAIWYQAHRRKTLAAWAAASGWTYVGTDPTLVDRWRGEPFGVGHSQRATDVMLGRWSGRPVVSFTYAYTTGSGKSESTYTFHVLAMALPAYLPTLALTPEGVGARLAKAFGGQDIQFESEEFNRAWRVECTDLKFAHDVVHPRLMTRLMRPDARGARLRISGTDIISWAGGLTRTEQIAPRLALLGAVVDAVPRFVWQNHGYDPGPGRVGRPGLPGAPGASGPPGAPGPSRRTDPPDLPWSDIVGQA